MATLEAFTQGLAREVQGWRRALSGSQVAGLLLTLALIVWSVPRALATLSYWWWYGNNMLSRTDFGLYYAFSLIGREIGWQHLYSLAAQKAVYAHLGVNLWWFPLPYTPPIAWLFAPFTLLPMATAYWVWAVITGLAFLGAWWISAPGKLLPKVASLTLALVPYLTLLALVLGQWVVIEVLAVALCAWALRHERQILAGLALTPAVLAPQAFLLVPFVLLVARRWRALVSWALVGMSLAVVSVTTLGLHGTQQYIQRLILAQRSPLEFAVDFHIVVIQIIGHHHAFQKVLVDLVVLAATGMGAWRHRAGSSDILLAIGILGSLLVATFLHLDDLLLLVPAAWLILRNRSDLWVVAPVLAMFFLALQIGYLSSPIWSTLFVIGEGCSLLLLALMPAGLHKANSTEPGFGATDRISAHVDPPPSVGL